MSVPDSRLLWLHAAATRYRSAWLLKMLGITIGITVFMVVYFTLLRHPAFPVTLMPTLELDRIIAFEPASAYLYASLWLYVGIAPAFLEFEKLPRYLASVVIVSLLGFSAFYFWPTAVPSLGSDWSAYPALAFLKNVDASGNACPSLHAAFAVLTAFWVHGLLGRLSSPSWTQILNGAWCLGILYSTLATRQHVTLDLLAGAALGAVVTLPLLRWPASRPAPRA